MGVISGHNDKNRKPEPDAGADTATGMRKGHAGTAVIAGLAAAIVATGGIAWWGLMASGPGDMVMGQSAASTSIVTHMPEGTSGQEKPRAAVQQPEGTAAREAREALEAELQAGWGTYTNIGPHVVDREAASTLVALLAGTRGLLDYPETDETILVGNFQDRTEQLRKARTTVEASMKEDPATVRERNANKERERQAQLEQEREDLDRLAERAQQEVEEARLRALGEIGA